MKFIGNVIKIFRDIKTNRFAITFLLDSEEGTEQLDLIRNFKKASLEVKKYHPKRSLDANAYAWVLIEKLARKLNTTKVEVYRKTIRELGIYEVVPIKKEAVERYIEIWEKNGAGWICEKTTSKLDGYVNILTYYGSSVFDSKEMHRFIDSLIE